MARAKNKVFCSLGTYTISRVAPTGICTNYTKPKA